LSADNPTGTGRSPLRAYVLDRGQAGQISEENIKPVPAPGRCRIFLGNPAYRRDVAVMSKIAGIFKTGESTGDGLVTREGNENGLLRIISFAKRHL
jgi:hypothetical protein